MILACALRLFATRGYHLTKVSDIVRESGCAQATFYWHFKSKLEMTMELFDTGRQSMLATVERGFRQHAVSTDDMMNNTRGWLLDLLSFARENRYFFAIVLAKGYGADPEIDAAISGIRTALFDALRRNIGQAVSLGMLPADGDIEARAAFVYHTIEGTIGWWLFGLGHDLDHESGIDAQTLAASMAKYEFFGLRG
ncbi:TetR/AcrR family transcriptional regulator [Pararobbsia silviterrae]|uniref:TetR/AcrR family transcriptional regulator n=1 Tax=Pararobbsia silviterrae TaxID=1792498 RepID=A0A494XLX8_9BURK|nr:TetR/AcrR family transcriptional regulator [Pararobbsia silviterrae]RKP49666.1 TetR/AcrR family transcriptional regulator [Pararobbsia silviterrae]